MCACKPNVRTPNCGSIACTAASFRNGEVFALKQAVEHLRGQWGGAADLLEKLIVEKQEAKPTR